jgi:hypothetical protein
VAKKVQSAANFPQNPFMSRSGGADKVEEQQSGEGLGTMLVPLSPEGTEA